MKKRILFLCTGNSCRSQMAEALTRHYLGKYFDVYSAGTKPKGVNAYAIEVMAELEINISDQRSKTVDGLLSGKFDLVLTLCDDAKESCPVFPGKTNIAHLSFEDPADTVGSDEEILKVFRIVRNDIQERVLEFLKEKYSIALKT